ncbi:MAG: flagellar hook-associated protein FlgK [Blastocatellia bacterium]|nr:flagellar hook-associated protein FlgK [Blastocatellia bacterium]
MGVNFSAFEIGRRALRAGQLGISVAGQNIANVNTPGYARQRAQLSASAPDTGGVKLTGAGVTIDGVRALRDQFIETRLQTETGISGRLEAKRDALAPVDAAFNDAGAGIHSAMVGFFGAFRDLEARPASVPLRAEVVARAESLATAFRGTRGRLDGIRADNDAALRSTVDEVNSLAARVADLNVRIDVAESANGGAAELRDQRGELVRRLTELTGARSTETEDGHVALTIGDGQAIVLGATAFTLTAESAPPDGLAVLTLDGQPATIDDGSLRGLQEAISEIGGHLASLDQLAESLASRVNALHASGADLDGNAGTALFVASGGGTVTAANIGIAAAIKSAPQRVVAAAAGAGSGDASVARAIAGLLGDRSSIIGASAGSYESFYVSLVTEAGAGVRSTEDALVTQQAILAQTQAQRESVSGVSLDEEAINLLQFQKAYEAAARFLRVADEMTQTILSLAQ